MKSRFRIPLRSAGFAAGHPAGLARFILPVLLLMASAHALEAVYTPFKDGYANPQHFNGTARTLAVRSGDSKAWVQHALPDAAGQDLASARLSLFVKDVVRDGTLKVFLATSPRGLEHQTRYDELKSAGTAMGSIGIKARDQIEEQISIPLSDEFVKAVKAGSFVGLLLEGADGLDAEIGAVEDSRGALLYLSYSAGQKISQAVYDTLVSKVIEKSGGNVQAVIGPKGDAGAIGPKGDKGDPGAIGPSGPAGSVGLTGAKGDKGDKGEPGAPGGGSGGSAITNFNQIPGKVNKSQLDADSVNGLQAKLGAKADTAAMITALAGKASTAALNAKADASALALKADASALALKANATDLAAKANAADLAAKADASALTAKANLSGANFTGRVGIGTASAAGPLDVRGGIATAGAGAPIVLAAQEGSTGNAGGNIVINSGANGVGSANGSIHFGTGGVVSATGALSVHESMRIDGTGNIGMGTYNRPSGVTPVASLDLYSTPITNVTQAFRTDAEYGNGVTGSYTANEMIANFGTSSSGRLTGLKVQVANATGADLLSASFAGGRVNIDAGGDSSTLDVTKSGGAGPIFRVFKDGPKSEAELVIEATRNGNVRIPGTLTVGTIAKTSGTFDIPHPDPAKAAQGMRLRHSFVESPTRGDNIYRFQVQVRNGVGRVALPGYFAPLNENPQIWITSDEQFAQTYGKVNPDMKEAVIHADRDGSYNVLIIATRRDKDAHQGWDSLGIEYVKTAAP
ncbi:MAG: collagen-like protein [Fibrobacteria bacterium]